MVLDFFKVLLVVGIIIPQYGGFFTGTNQLKVAFNKLLPEKNHHQRIRIHLEADEQLMVPKHATVKYLAPPTPLLPQIAPMSDEEMRLYSAPPTTFLSEHHSHQDLLQALEKSKQLALKSHHSGTGSKVPEGEGKAGGFQALFQQAIENVGFENEAKQQHEEVVPPQNSGNDVKPVTEEDDFGFDFRAHPR